MEGRGGGQLASLGDGEAAGGREVEPGQDRTGRPPQTRQLGAVDCLASRPGRGKSSVDSSGHYLSLQPQPRIDGEAIVEHGWRRIHHPPAPSRMPKMDAPFTPSLPPSTDLVLPRWDAGYSSGWEDGRREGATAASSRDSQQATKQARKPWLACESVCSQSSPPSPSRTPTALTGNVSLPLSLGRLSPPHYTTLHYTPLHFPPAPRPEVRQRSTGQASRRGGRGHGVGRSDSTVLYSPWAFPSFLGLPPSHAAAAQKHQRPASAPSPLTTAAHAGPATRPRTSRQALPASLPPYLMLLSSSHRIASHRMGFPPRASPAVSQEAPARIPRRQLREASLPTAPVPPLIWGSPIVRR